jgi:hypothetical protein
MTPLPSARSFRIPPDLLRRGHALALAMNADTAWRRPSLSLAVVAALRIGFTELERKYKVRLVKGRVTP